MGGLRELPPLLAFVNPWEGAGHETIGRSLQSAIGAKDHQHAVSRSSDQVSDIQIDQVFTASGQLGLLRPPAR